MTPREPPPSDVVPSVPYPLSIGPTVLSVQCIRTTTGDHDPSTHPVLVFDTLDVVGPTSRTLSALSLLLTLPRVTVTKSTTLSFTTDLGPGRSPHFVPGTLVLPLSPSLLLTPAPSSAPGPLSDPVPCPPSSTPSGLFSPGRTKASKRRKTSTKSKSTRTKNSSKKKTLYSFSCRCGVTSVCSLFPTTRETLDPGLWVGPLRQSGRRSRVVTS